MESPRTDLDRAARRSPDAPASPDGSRGEPRTSVFANRNFRLFFTGQLVSNTGTWLPNVAQGVLVLRLTNHLARVSGPVIATAASAAFGFGLACGLNSLSSLAPIVALLRLRRRRAGRGVARGGSIREVAGGAWWSPRLRLRRAGVAAV